VQVLSGSGSHPAS